MYLLYLFAMYNLQFSRIGCIRYTRDDRANYECDIANITHVRRSFNGHDCFLRHGIGSTKIQSNGASNGQFRTCGFHEAYKKPHTILCPFRKGL